MVECFSDTTVVVDGQCLIIRAAKSFSFCTLTITVSRHRERYFILESPEYD